jgi:hypothetical protein
MAPIPDPQDSPLDVLGGGGPPRRVTPRWLVLAIEVAVGAVALVWVGLTIADQVEGPEPTPAALTVVGNPQPSYGPGHGEIIVNLRNASESPLYLDSVTLLNIGAESDDPWPPAWAQARIIEPAGGGPPFEGIPAIDLKVPGHGGTAALMVTIDPPCKGTTPLPGEVVVSYHTDKGSLGQVILPELLAAGSTSLPAMVSGACATLSDLNSTAPPRGDLSSAQRYSETVADVPFSFAVPTDGWQNDRNLYIGTSTLRGRGAEAILFWTGVVGVPNGVTSCGQWWGTPTGGIADYAAAAARAPGARPLSGPSTIRVGGHDAATVVLRIRRPGTCNQGFFYTWPVYRRFALWGGADEGDTVRMWIVDVDDRSLVIEAITRQGAGRAVRPEIQEIVRSIQFD